MHRFHDTYRKLFTNKCIGFIFSEHLGLCQKATNLQTQPELLKIRMGFLRSDKKLSTPASTSPCANLRAAYDQCFNRWYSEKFLKGKWDKEECVSEWNKYRECLFEYLDDKHLARFLEAEGIGNMIHQVDASSPKGAPT